MVLWQRAMTENPPSAPLSAKDWFLRLFPDLVEAYSVKKSLVGKTAFQALGRERQVDLLSEKWGVPFSRTSMKRALAGGFDPKTIEELEARVRVKCPRVYTEYVHNQEMAALKGK